MLPGSDPERLPDPLRQVGKQAKKAGYLDFRSGETDWCGELLPLVQRRVPPPVRPETRDRDWWLWWTRFYRRPLRLALLSIIPAWLLIAIVFQWPPF